MCCEIEESWVECYGSTSRVITLGQSTVNSLELLDKEELVLIIPGNPGCSKMFESFMSSLKKSIGNPGLSIWTFSYIGHDSELPSFFPVDQTYTLEDQVQHKLELIDKLVPRSTKITMIGHSIGCKVIMEIFRRNRTHDIQEVFFLFPAIENMVSTMAGRLVWPIVNIFRHLAIFIVLLVSLVPRGILTFLTGQIFQRSQKSFISSSVEVINANIVNNIMVLAKDELDNVLDLDVNTIKKLVGKLHLYYAEKDGWCPLTYKENILEKVPDLGPGNARVDRQGIPHAFAVEHGDIMGTIIGDWITEGRLQQ